MKLPFRPPKKKKLQATTARRAREADFTEEPNVKLSSAFVVVLVLHIVAVGGIYAFNAIKAHQPATYEETADNPQPAAPVQTQPVASAQANTPAAPATAPAAPQYYRVKSGDTIARIASAYTVSAESLISLNDLEDIGGIHVGQELKLPAGAVIPADAPVAPKVAPVKDSGNYYTVKSGDTPVSIAHKLHVVYDDLIKLNRIEDPKKLKIGSRLKVPMRRSSQSTSQGSSLASAQA
jgi:LysM repeat protein